MVRQEEIVDIDIDEIIKGKLADGSFDPRTDSLLKLYADIANGDLK